LVEQLVEKQPRGLGEIDVGENGDGRRLGTMLRGKDVQDVGNRSSERRRAKNKLGSYLTVMHPKPRWAQGSLFGCAPTWCCGSLSTGMSYGAGGREY
jgi:hypothetical protein